MFCEIEMFPKNPPKLFWEHFKNRTIMATLTFSLEKLFSNTDNSNKMVEGSTIERTFYDGKEFTSRMAEGEKDQWKDTEVIYEGVVDESKITRATVDQYELYCELRSAVCVEE